MKNILFFFFCSCVCIVFIRCGTESSNTSEPTKQPPKAEIPDTPPSNARFELIPASESKVTFSNNIRESARMNIVTNSYMYNGGGVAVLDVNNDDLPDLYFSSSQEANRLYLNMGNFTFRDITNQPGVAALGGFKTGVTVVDINNDGFQDIYVCRSGLEATEERRNSFFINNGDLTFTDKAVEYGLADMSASNHANFFDYDLDGDLDVYIINHPTTFAEVNKVSVKQIGDEYVRKTTPRNEFESDKLFRNNGNGSFTDVSVQAGIQNKAWSLSVTVSDFNKDGYPDIFVGNDYIEPDLLYMNNGNGTFTNRTDDYFRHTSNHTMGVDIADYNNDGLVDLVALDMIAEDNQRYKELMTTMILERYNHLVRFHYGHQIMRNSLQVNNGNGTFSEVGTLAGISNTDWSWACLLADFDNDTWKDLFISNGYRRDVTNLDYLNYTVDSINRVGGLGIFKDINDYLNKIPTKKLQNYMYRNQGDLTFEKATYDWGLIQKSYSNGAAYADLDADGDLDLIVNNIHENAFIYRNKTAGQSGANYLQIKLKGDKNNIAGIGTTVTIYAGDQQQYQEMTPTRGFFSSMEHLLHFGLGNTLTIDKVEVVWADGKVQILENVNANQRLILNYSDAKKRTVVDIERPNPLFRAVDNLGVNFQHRENEFEDFNRERLLPHRFSGLGPNFSVGDVNGDGLEDFYVGGAVNQPGALFVQQANATFKEISAQTWYADLAQEDLGSTFFDADGDGDLDLYVVSGGNEFPLASGQYQDRLYLNDGKGNFAKNREALPRMDASGTCVSAHDFDGDGDLDAFVGGCVSPEKYPTAPVSFILQNNGGTFTDVTAQVAPDFQNIGMVTDIKWADLDGDGVGEMIVTGEWLPISIFKKEGKRLKNVTAQFGLNKTNGWWNCLQAVDFDKDGDLDLVAGNLGLNSRLRASEQEPLRLYAKDFDNNGQIDPVLAYYENGVVYPLPTRDMMIKQMPELKKKYVRFRKYATATLEDVFPKSELQSAQLLEAKVFATTYFENVNGKFQAKPLPLAAQLSPTNQIQVLDANGDGHLDLLLAGNDYDADVETGRYDAGNGTLLIGDGKGDFEVMLNQKSGFWAMKEVRDLAIVPLANGKQLVLVGNNNAKVEGFVK